MSKLIDLLDRIAQRSDEPLGFGARNAGRVPTMALICLLPEAREDQVEAALQSGADAVLLPTTGAAGVLPRAVSLAQVRPLGVTAHEGAITGQEAEGFREQGADFCLIHPGQAALSVLNVDLGWIMRLDNSFPPEELVAVGSLEKVGAVAAAIAMGRALPDSPSTYTVQDMMRLAAMVRLTRRPVLLALQKPLPAECVSMVREAGATGIIATPHVLESGPAAVAQITRSLRQAIDGLPRVRGGAKRRGEGVVAMVPRLPALEEAQE